MSLLEKQKRQKNQPSKMKSLDDFKTALLEEEKSDYSKFDMLVRAGLANKAQLQRIHRILDKMQDERPQFNNADKMILQNLFNKMVDILSNNKQIFQQTRRVVKEELEEGVIDSSDYKISASGKKVRAHRIVLTPGMSDQDDAQEQDSKKLKQESTLEEATFDPPAVLVLKRKAIRLYPNDTRIALYYNDKLGKYFSVPYSTDKQIDAPVQAEETQLEEAANGIDQLKKIRDSKQHGVVNHRDGSASKVDHFTASAILAVHDKVNDENKKKLNNMVSSSHYHMQKVAQFAFNKAK